MSYLTIQYGSGILYKKIEILENDITYNYLKVRICDSKILYIHEWIKIQEEYELFHNDKIINIDEEIDFHKNPLNIVFTTKYYKTDELCRYAIDKYYGALGFVKNKTNEFCRYIMIKIIEHQIV